MAERTSTLYQRLFTVRLLHHYWLDEGATVFDAIPEAAARDARLLRYDIRPVLRVAPTPATAELIAGFGGVFRTLGIGFVVGVPTSARFPADMRLTFTVAVTDSRFFDVTALTLRPQPVVELPGPDGTMRRFKENVSNLSNLTGTTRGSGTGASLYLSRAIPAATTDDRVEALVASGGTLLQLAGDNPGAETMQIGTLASLPAFLSQADAPPLAGPAGAPARGVELTPDLPDDSFAVISLTAVNSADPRFSFVTAATGAPAAVPPVYDIRFRNRATRRVYRDRRSGTVLSSAPQPLPLTVFGNAGTTQKPEPGLLKAELSGTRITRLVSEIYI